MSQAPSLVRPTLGIMRVFPFLIARPAARPLLIEAAHRPLVLRVDALLLRQFLHILPIGLFGIAMHQGRRLALASITLESIPRCRPRKSPWALSAESTTSKTPW
jgi:hypothetical protein